MKWIGGLAGLTGLVRQWRERIGGLLKRLNLAQQFMLASFTILVISMLALGEWVSQQIETGVINRTSGETALYVDSFIDPRFRNLEQAHN